MNILDKIIDTKHIYTLYLLNNKKQSGIIKMSKKTMLKAYKIGF